MRIRATIDLDKSDSDFSTWVSESFDGRCAGSVGKGGVMIWFYGSSTPLVSFEDVEIID